jgi:hypothetical protein
MPTTYQTKYAELEASRDLFDMFETLGEVKINTMCDYYAGQLAIGESPKETRDFMFQSILIMTHYNKCGANLLLDWIEEAHEAAKDEAFIPPAPYVPEPKFTVYAFNDSTAETVTVAWSCSAEDVQEVAKDYLLTQVRNGQKYVRVWSAPESSMHKAWEGEE